MSKSPLALILVFSLGLTQITSAHLDGVNANGCHTPGGTDSGNPCHCHAPGDFTEELACENGAPVQGGSQDDDDVNSESGDDSDDAEDASPTTWLGLRVEDQLECDGEGQRYIRDHYAYDSDADITIAHTMGGIYGPYEDRCFDSYRDVTVEHMVSANEGHKSGMCERDIVERYTLGNDLLNLTLASSEVNSFKSNKDPGEWEPDYNKCWYVYRVIEVKRKYDMSIDERERDAMKRILADCSVEDLYLVPRDDCALPEE
ncbi:MAG: DUF1524 domain-containing protein [Gammaproteobacteria bacterium]|nr:DUF1524 domain-containing protein [Gammaproteobacteria bacterium]